MKPIFAVGDVHGEIELLKKNFKKTGIGNRNNFCFLAI
ncbi:hypothetical protein MFLO_12516 [Listeria floridensis FSL S10-1187]|uniref:Serine/threonine protein phosphatase n=1 Tax=Listeria floridensis FSL S10-1187 TaxID=1265817 RepID=A0ABP3AVQ5_9LIST|nr:hypothetical protein MFLO_12516 [Listeria floridensis FSL S10-1187]